VGPGRAAPVRVTQMSEAARVAADRPEREDGDQNLPSHGLSSLLFLFGFHSPSAVHVAGAPRYGPPPRPQPPNRPKPPGPDSMRSASMFRCRSSSASWILPRALAVALRIASAAAVALALTSPSVSSSTR